MRTYNMHFESTTLWCDLSFWKILVLNFIQQADSIRIDCWNEEEEAIKRLLALNGTVDKEENSRMTIFKFEVNEKIIEEVVHNAFNENRQLLWFSLFLESEGETFFSSEHHGTEYSITEVTKDELKWVKRVVPKNFNL